jgi:hypothetical protein
MYKRSAKKNSVAEKVTLTSHFTQSDEAEADGPGHK